MSKHVDIYRSVTDKVISQLKQGIVPWVRPWGTEQTAPVALPRNASTERTYAGINILLLWGAAFDAGHGSQLWLTYKQAQAMGGQVRKGEKATHVVYVDRFIPREERERATETGKDPRSVPFLKRHAVFNVDQVDGLPEAVYGSNAPLPEREAVPHAEALIKATGADFRIGGNQAVYYPSTDHIQVPPQPAFRDQINYYRTCFHELGHWTGHETRLARTFSGRFGSHAYAREELVAEMTAAFVCAALGISPTVRHADYIGSWLRVLREDNRAIFNAASLASKAADYLLAFETEEPELAKAA